MKTSGEYGQQQEIRLCEKLIRIIGPNSSAYKNKYKHGYSDIIDTLRLLREDYNIWEPILIAQEITYIRECYGRDENLEKKIRISRLEEAIQIASNILSKMEYIGVSVGTRNAIIVESANSKLLLSQVTNHQPCWWFAVSPTGPMLLFRLKAVWQTIILLFFRLKAV